MFHRIYESMELGMHPTIPYPRRSRVAPSWWKCAGRLDHSAPLETIDCTVRRKRCQTLTAQQFGAWPYNAEDPRSLDPHQPSRVTCGDLRSTDPSCARARAHGFARTPRG